MSPIGVGILGLGQRGLQHLNVLWRLQRLGLARVVGLADRFPENLDPAKLRRYVSGFSAEGVLRTTDWRDLLDDQRVEALFVCLPPGVHAGEVEAAARSGRHLFVEKPMSLYLDQALRMERAIRESGVVAVVGFQHRYDARNEAVRQFLADKRVVMLTMVHHAPLEDHSVKHTPTDRLGGPVDRVWTANRRWSGTTVVEAGIHQVDLMRSWAGDVEWVEATYLHRLPDEIVESADNPHAYRVTLGFANGAIGNLLMTRIRRAFFSERYWSVQWTEGHLRWEGGHPVAYTYRGPYPPRRRPQLREIRHPLPLPVAYPPTEAIQRAFLLAVAGGPRTTLRSSFFGSMNSLEAVLAANASDARGGRRVYLDAFRSDPEYAADRRPPS